MGEYATAPMVHYARTFCGGPCVVCGVAMTQADGCGGFERKSRLEPSGAVHVLANGLPMYNMLCGGERKRTYRDIGKDLP